MIFITRFSKFFKISLSIFPKILDLDEVISLRISRAAEPSSSPLFEPVWLSPKNPLTIDFCICQIFICSLSNSSSNLSGISGSLFSASSRSRSRVRRHPLAIPIIVVPILRSLIFRVWRAKFMPDSIISLRFLFKPLSTCSGHFFEKE
ncbi:hypothetical protein AKJ64_00065 [candidate division MSBL1 archaeon SCGC-AAA259E17]|uniref:Uncharacterized protein n=1 Tax=candidate division MSBL1 archaeon SCGC-AAA259E17 TaxID=1698263 RepID=A0A133UH85_9EURY|nr:hypothetical protein AKJ64_00065 [candidate division MSBL1 archaeon SCGC-AAA259E17]